MANIEWFVAPDHFIMGNLILIIFGEIVIGAFICFWVHMEIKCLILKVESLKLAVEEETKEIGKEKLEIIESIDKSDLSSTKRSLAS